MLIKRYSEGTYIVLGVSYLNKLDATTKGTKQFSDPQALSSALIVLGMLQSWGFRLLHHLVPLVLVSNYYIATYTPSCIGYCYNSKSNACTT